LPSYSTAGGKYLIRPVDLIGFMQSNNMFVHETLLELAKQDEIATQSAAPAVDESSRETSQEPAILVVDDESYARALAVRTLQKLDIPILEAEDGYEAMHLLTQHPEIGIVVLDLIMPGQDGIKTYELIREQNKSLPVIIVTGNPPDESAKVFGEQEPDLIITKPYHPSHLSNAASAFLSDLGF
jgi:CheY-like chemotaxis protein